MQKHIKQLCAAGAALLICMRAHADEAMGESDATLSDMFWGALIIGIGYFIWKKWRG